MTCRAILVLTGMLSIAGAPHATHGQAPRRQTLADRMAALGRSWTQDESEESLAAENAPYGNRPQPNRVREQPSRGRFPQIDARALLPTNLFGGRDEEQPTTVPPPSAHRSVQSSPQRRTPSTGIATPRSQSGATNSPPVRTASRPRVGSIHERDLPQGDFTLPGLGGSRLPTGTATSTNAPPTRSTNGVDISREIVRDNLADRTAIQPKTGDSLSSSYSTSGANNHREIATGDASDSSSSTRQSPPRRTPIQIDPDELRRELAGAFPAPADDDQDEAPASSAAPPNTTTRPKEPASPITTPVVVDPTPITGSPSEEPTPAPEPIEDSSTIYIPSQSTDVPFSLPTADDNTAPAPTHQRIAPSHSSAQSQGQIRPMDTPASEAPTPRDGTTIFDAASGNPGDSLESDISFGLNSTHSPSSIKAPATGSGQPAATRRREAFGEPNSTPTSDPSLLATHQTPVITTDIRGPKQILVGREATYRVRLQNQGQIPAEGIIATIRIPSGADVIDTTTTHGMIGPAQDAESSNALQWQLAKLEAGASETLDVRLVPRSSRPLELGVSWTLAPVGSRAIVEVQEPKLRLHVSGPDEVLFGKAQLYRLTLSNPGTGVAENVTIDLMPPGGGDNAVTSHPVGDLGAGISQTIEVELTAREAGKLFVNAIASADGGLSFDAAKEIFCRKPELEVDWRGPEKKYTGTEATHFVRVRNPGTAPAEDVKVTIHLPRGATLVSASEGQTFDAERGELAWRIGSLGPGDDYYVEFKCLVNSPGTNEMKITATTATGDLVDTHVATTDVVALADLKLEVSDPQGPVAVGDEAVYEIRVLNRGQGAAKDVNVVALFSAGVEPNTVEGAMHTVADGRVSFQTIEELGPGKQITLRIRANARQAGTHVFRAEVLSRDIKLAAEETTRFYADDVFDSTASMTENAAASADQSQPSEQPTGDVGSRYQTGSH